MNAVKGWMSPTRRAVWQWTGLPREVVDPSALGSFKKKLDRLLSEMLQEAGVGLGDLVGPFQLYNSLWTKCEMGS